ncbi:type II toxin-antitoxin system mRNA interferase toxin, RelE/StbE family [Brunnivagina elsteri CCALA 953]|uniref:Type II toxin-antitoxin system mRNA interferase toxin, RelE/StbE family n=1 Tax=Brunnivagina elsteri CCALA 953 TaxID=987040 RepID=A0A2A2TC37_9CYAN|nr:type II toxin-antitoxin system RelE/ParE family toxin [Calothrix elsteri]PAX51273.1 type II toxin-antitoxin system mRNA interferase toxin, RelE/StbE family [Calothrix elsteri CCALA 953]
MIQVDALPSNTISGAVIEKILDSTRTLSNFLLLGRIVPEFKEDSIREVFAYSYRIIYQIQDETVIIAAVVHGKRLLNQFKNTEESS